MKAYLNLAIGAPKRIAYLRGFVESHNAQHKTNNTWRNVRFGSLRQNDCGLSQGFNGSGRHRTPIWSAWKPQFRHEKDYAEFCPRSRHTGYYCDPDGQNTCIGIVAMLTHGRFIAGYRLTDNDERVYYPEIFDDEKEAAQMGDEHARVAAEQEYEHQVKWQAAQAIRDDMDQWALDLDQAIALRHHKRHGANARVAIADLIEKIRDARTDLSTNYVDCE